MRFRFFVFFILLTGCAVGQSDRLMSQRIIDVAEQYISSNEGNADFDTYLERLEYYAQHPINLNVADRVRLSSLGILNELDIQNILDYRTRLGDFVEVQELILAGIDKQKVQSISFFLTVKHIPVLNAFKNPNFKKELNHQIFMRYQRVLQERKGFVGDNPNFLGDANKYYIRYAVNYHKQIQAGFVLEKDDGEQFFNGNNKSGFDYSNAYLGVKSKSIFKTTIVGAYSLHLGQGLVSWSGLGFGKSVFALDSKKIGEILRPYTSVNEYGFYRGVASQIKINKLTVIPYVSYKQIDGNVTSVVDGEVESFSAIQKTGYHRTASEIENNKSIKETVAGLSVGTSMNRFELRTNYQFSNYSAKLEPSSVLYQKFNFEGNRLHVLSVDYRYNFKKMALFGEHAVQSQRKQAHLIGGIARLHPKLDIITIYRDYSTGYYAIHANGFGEGSTTSNEKGIYTGFGLKPTKGWEVNAYIDSYKKPWFSFNSFGPSAGTDFQIQIDRNLHDDFNYYLRFKHEINQVNTSNNDQINNLTDQTKWRLRYHVNIITAKDIKLRTRLELSARKAENQKEIGTLLYQDVKFSLFHHKLDLTTRVAYFNIPSFSTAIYAYEHDVLYAFSVPAYYSQGTRFYLLSTFHLTKELQMWIRYSRWLYTDTEVISSGNLQIIGDAKSELKVQLRALF